MKKLSSKLLLLPALLLMSALCYAKVADSTRQADHEMLRALREEVTTALNNRDIESLAACFTKEFVMTGVDQTVITTEDQLIDYFARMFDAPESLLVSMKAQPEATILTRFLSDNIGICYGTSTDTYTLKRGAVSVVDSRWTATVVKQNGEWKIATVHAGVNLLDNPVLNGRVAAARARAAGTGAAGFALGLLVMWLFKRKKH